MKKITTLLVLIIVGFITPTSAQLILGGDITWQCVTSGPDAGKHIFKLTLFNQCDSGVLASSQTINVHNASISSIAVSLTNESDINFSCYDPLQTISCVGGKPGAMSMGVYESAPVLLTGVPPSGGWVFTWTHTNRLLTNSNLASGSGFTLRSIMYNFNGLNASTCYDNSPQFIDGPITSGCTGYSFKLNHRSYDPDNDAVSYSFADPLDYATTWPASPVGWKSGYSANNPFPGTAINANNQPGTISAVSGEISFLNHGFTDSRMYYAVKAESKRDGMVISEVYRDVVLGLQVCPPTATIPPLANTPPQVEFKNCPSCPTLPMPVTMNIIAGDTVQFHVSTTDIQFLPGFIGQSNYMKPRGSQFGTAYADPLNGCDQPPCAIMDTNTTFYNSTDKIYRGQFGLTAPFKWITDSVHGSPNGNVYLFHFTAQDDWCPYPGLNDQTVTIRVYSQPDNVIEGQVYEDLNSNGTKDAGENGRANIIMKQSPHGFYYNTKSDGTYSFGAYQGSHEVSIAAIPRYHEITTPVSGKHTIVSTGTGMVYGGNDFGIRPIPNINDLMVDLYYFPLSRPGWLTSGSIFYKNVGTTTLNVSVDFEFDGPLSYHSSTTTPSAITGNQVSWNFTNLSPNQSGFIHVQFRVDSTANFGDSILSYVTINPLAGDTVPANNIDSMLNFVTSSFDPNEKTVSPEGPLLASAVHAGQMMEYVIHFQNTGNDSAINIVIEDEIQSSLDIETFEFIGSSHTVTYEIKEKTITWTFDNIYLPDSTTNFTESMGFVKYRIMANTSLNVGDTIFNAANIYFDLNTPVYTEVKTGIVDVIDGIETSGFSDSYRVHIYPNPSQAIFNVNVKYLQEDMLSYAVYSISGQFQQTGQIKKSDTDCGNGTIDLSTAPRGIYFVRFNGIDQVVTKKIVLN